MPDVVCMCPPVHGGFWGVSPVLSFFVFSKNGSRSRAGVCGLPYVMTSFFFLFFSCSFGCFRLLSIHAINVFGLVLCFLFGSQPGKGFLLEARLALPKRRRGEPLRYCNSSSVVRQGAPLFVTNRSKESRTCGRVGGSHKQSNV